MCTLPSQKTRLQTPYDCYSRGGWGIVRLLTGSSATLRVWLRVRNKALVAWINVPTFQRYILSSQRMLLQMILDCCTRRVIVPSLPSTKGWSDRAGLAQGWKWSSSGLHKCPNLSEMYSVFPRNAATNDLRLLYQQEIALSLPSTRGRSDRAGLAGGWKWSSARQNKCPNVSEIYSVFPGNAAANDLKLQY